MTSQTHKNLAEALAAVQAVIPPVLKAATAEIQTAKGSYSYSYADLADVTPVILPLLGQHGLAFTTRPTLHDVYGFVLHYALIHDATDERIEGFYPLDSGGTPQQMGGLITYARRYTLCAVTGLAPGGDDDDAKAAEDNAKTTPTKARTKPVPVATEDWAQQILDANTVDELRAVYAAAEKAGELGHRFNPRHAKMLQGVVAHYGLENPPSGVTIGQMLNAAHGALQARVAAESRTTEWETAEIPEDMPDEIAAPPEDD